MSRMALGTGGADYRAQVQDMVVLAGAQQTIETFWHGSQSTMPDPEGWKSKAQDELIHNVNVAELEYAQCTSLGPTPDTEHSWPLRDDNLIGKLAANINDILSENHDLALRLEVATLTVKTVSESRIGLHVQELWRNL